MQPFSPRVRLIPERLLVALLLTLLASVNPVTEVWAQDKTEFEQITAESSYSIRGSIEEVFELFTPRGRTERLNNWTVEFIYEREMAS